MLATHLNVKTTNKHCMALQGPRLAYHLVNKISITIATKNCFQMKSQTDSHCLHMTLFLCTNYLKIASRVVILRYKYHKIYTFIWTAEE